MMRTTRWAMLQRWLTIVAMQQLPQYCLSRASLISACQAIYIAYVCVCLCVCVYAYWNIQRDIKTQAWWHVHCISATKNCIASLYSRHPYTQSTKPKYVSTSKTHSNEMSPVYTVRTAYRAIASWLLKFCIAVSQPFISIERGFSKKMLVSREQRNDGSSDSYVMFTRWYRPAGGPVLCPVSVDGSVVCPPDVTSRTHRRIVRRTKGVTIFYST
jgi:hypothetical protein